MAGLLQERGQYVSKCAVVVDQQDAPDGHNGGGGHHELSWDGRPEGFYGPSDVNRSVMLIAVNVR
jgi:hypothetical protein